MNMNLIVVAIVKDLAIPLVFKLDMDIILVLDLLLDMLLGLDIDNQNLYEVRAYYSD